MQTRCEEMIAIHRSDITDFETASRREWLVTNGLGGYAAGTIADATTRRYHGLLVAALRPPVQRTVLVAKFGTRVSYVGREFSLDSNEYVDGTINPAGYRYLESFCLDVQIPTWTWTLADAVLVRRIWMKHGENTTYVSYTLDRASSSMQIDVEPLCTGRDYHWQSSEYAGPGAQPIPGGCEVGGFSGAPTYRITADRGAFHGKADWHRDIRHAVEAERGLDDREDLFRPGVFRLSMEQGDTVTFVCTTSDTEATSGEDALAAEHRRLEKLTASLDSTAPGWIRKLVLAADQFVVERRGTDNQNGTSVIAGYPWFADWGRDTMIALPGLTLDTGRPDVAASILRTFAEHVSDGMLPNRFPDAGEEAEYNTVDATLWYFDAIDRYLNSTGDDALGRDLYPLLKEIVDWHIRGTRYGIRVDPIDNLLFAGTEGVQLTWMDAKVGDWVVTPRIGKPVEISALWHNALRVIARVAADQDDGVSARRYRNMAEAVADSFRRRFWCATGSYLYDVIDGSGEQRDAIGRTVDASLRPNQIFAVSLPGSLLRTEQAKSVVGICARELWTPVGLRSLAQSDPDYVGRYGGGPLERDGAYHQGTVWSWLLGPFVSAHYKVFGDAASALSFLAPIAAHLKDGCVGSVSEIFDGDEPHNAGGCFAQAWSVAETLRAWNEIRRATAGTQSLTRVRSA